MTNESEDLQKRLTPDHIALLKALLQEPDPQKMDYVHSIGQAIRERCGPIIALKLDELVRDLEAAGLVVHLTGITASARSGRGAEDLRSHVTPAGLKFAATVS